MKDITDRWEYIGNQGRVSHACLESYASVILKNQRHKLWKIWESAGKGKRVANPPSVKPDEWARLISYFKSEQGKVRSEQMTQAWTYVKTPNPGGRKGTSNIQTSTVCVELGVWLN